MQLSFTKSHTLHVSEYVQGLEFPIFLNAYNVTPERGHNDEVM